MLESKRNRIILLFGFILFLAGSFFTLDWTLYVLGLASFVKPEVLYVRITKTCTSFCIALLVWIIGNDGVNVKDTKKLKVCFIAIFAGDLLFLLDEFWASFDLFAVIMFALGHILIIMRNGQSFRIYLKKTDRARERRLDMISLSIIVAITVILYLLVLYPSVTGTQWVVIFPVYAIVLDLSLWIALTSTHIEYFPRKNAVLIAVGASSFFIGDFLVGINLSFPPGWPQLTSLFLTWVFYMPAILLLALSGYQWVKTVGT